MSKFSVISCKETLQSQSNKQFFNEPIHDVFNNMVFKDVKKKKAFLMAGKKQYQKMRHFYEWPSKTWL